MWVLGTTLCFQRLSTLHLSSLTVPYFYFRECLFLSSFIYALRFIYDFLCICLPQWVYVYMWVLAEAKAGCGSSAVDLQAVESCPVGAGPSHFILSFISFLKTGPYQAHSELSILLSQPPQLRLQRWFTVLQLISLLKKKLIVTCPRS